MSTLTFEQAKQKFVRQGIHPRFLIPIVPYGATSALSPDVHGKAPGYFDRKRGMWSGLYGSVLTKGMTKELSDNAKDWPTENVGALGMEFPAIDSDAESPEAWQIIDQAIFDTFPKNLGLRLRGNGHRRLYAFRQNPDEDQVRTRHLAYKLSDGSVHKLDIIGLGSQYVISGLHNNGKDHYTWDDAAPFNDDICEIGNGDIDRFIDRLKEILVKKGGELIKVTGASQAYSERDLHEMDPVLPVDAILEGLKKVPNTPENFPFRDNIVGALAAIRAALGRESFNPDVQADIEDWACADEDWCPREYFEKIWRSLDTVRVTPRAIEKIFADHKVTSHIKHHFPKDDSQRVISKAKKQEAEITGDLLGIVARDFVFSSTVARSGFQYVVRPRFNLSRELPCYSWWRNELIESNPQLLDAIQELDTYGVGKGGMANFLRDLRQKYPDCFYEDYTYNPLYGYGEMIREEGEDGVIVNKLNLRHLSPAQIYATQPDPNPAQSQADVRHITDFINRMFGNQANYELDTLAFMAQKKLRPSSLLLLVGDSGVGKSILTVLYGALFDGKNNYGTVDGVRLIGESSRRFALSGIAGCRIVNIREMPSSGGRRGEMAVITAQLKTMVDPGPDGDKITIERKGENAKVLPNFARIIISTNYADAVEIEQQDRRIFYVNVGITLDNKPDRDYYQHLVDLINSPERLAAFWRYLMARDISGYNRDREPPVSSAKAEAQAQKAEKPIERHMLAALEWLRASDRIIFTARELADMMSELSEREFANSGGDIDDRSEYSAKSLMFSNTVKKVLKPNRALKLDTDKFRTTMKRFPSVYVVAGHKGSFLRFQEMYKDELEDALETEENRGLGPHPWAIFQKATKDTD
jgi:hypothetical protein